MLCLSRKLGERIILGAGSPFETIITVLDTRGDVVKLGFDAPKNVTIHRKEIQDAIDREKREAASSTGQAGAEDSGGSGEPVS